MKPLFLDRPDAWTRTPRTGRSRIDQACAVQIHTDPTHWQDRLVLWACVAALVALAVIMWGEP